MSDLVPGGGKERGMKMKSIIVQKEETVGEEKTDG